jgi:hypothetical protein
MNNSTFKSVFYTVLFLLSTAFGSLISCSSAKFTTNDDPAATAIQTSTNCVQVSEGVFKCTDTFKVGAGKVDILFVDDNSASMSGIHKKLAAKFGGFIESLDAKEIDYRIGITTTDLAAVQKDSMITFANGSKILTKNDSNRVGLFNAGIARAETVACEDFIKSSYYTYGAGFNSTPYYTQNYYSKCASSDERGLYTAHEVISSNSNSLIRPDAHLNIILVSNEDVRSGQYSTNSSYILDTKDKASGFTTMMNSTYPSKYWEFNSIITKDNSCANTQKQSFKDNTNHTILDASGNYVVGANIGLEYAALSASAATDIDGNPRPRGKILSICQNDYTSYFANIAANISAAARLMPLKCTAISAPTVSRVNNANLSVPYQWQGDKILFQAGSEGIPVSVTYECRITTAH